MRAHAVHPGYGFLSENADFAQGCIDAGLIFVGPPPQAIRAMGSKSASKASMAAAGVPVAPGYHGSDQSPAHLAAEAAAHRFSSHHQGERGRRRQGDAGVHSAAEVPAAVESARRLARTAFGDDRLLFERYFPAARHVEVQVFADSHGETVALFDRDCSVQRRHQKIIEEAPAPGLRPEVRAAMSQAAITAARAVGYVGAGTVEFLVDPAQQFYFMEMNTRLQVEHPVTELITGVDLVEWQLEVACGGRLPSGAAAIAPRGAAIEARLYAEDPAHDYLPSVGRITHLRWPDSAGGELRLDVGVDAGDEVSPFYDPMLGKLIAGGESRAQAIDTLHRALGLARDRRRDDQPRAAAKRACRCAVSGGRCHHELSRDAPRSLVFRRAEPRNRRLHPGGALVCLGERRARGALGGYVGMAVIGARRLASALRRERRESSSIVVRDRLSRASRGRGRMRYALIRREAGSLEAEIGGSRERAHGSSSSGAALELFRTGRHATLTARSTEDALQPTAEADAGSLVTPLPGTVVAVHATSGQSVERGAPLITHRGHENGAHRGRAVCGHGGADCRSASAIGSRRARFWPS